MSQAQSNAARSFGSSYLECSSKAEIVRDKDRAAQHVSCFPVSAGVVLVQVVLYEQQLCVLSGALVSLPCSSLGDYHMDLVQVTHLIEQSNDQLLSSSSSSRSSISYLIFGVRV